MFKRNCFFVFFLVLAEFGQGNVLQRKAVDESQFHPVPKRSKAWTRQKEVEAPEVWFNLGQNVLKKRLTRPVIEEQAKNLILFIGDGMSVSTLTAARIFKGQRVDKLPFGEEGELYMDTLPFTGSSKTFCADWQVADSACSSTAYFTGTKGNALTVGVSPAVGHNDCQAQMNPVNQLESIVSWAQKAGMSTGLVTSTSVTHASPAGAFAHSANRDWENDAKIEESGLDSGSCDDIAEQLVLNKPGQELNVILGGGRSHWLPNTVMDIEGKYGKRNDGKNLIDTWHAHKNLNSSSYLFVTGRSQLLASDLSGVDYLLGLFAPEHIEYADKQLENDDPSLAEMTTSALTILQKNPKGFFLFVEGGRIDQAHHANNAHRALVETLQFDEAIHLADNKTEDIKTLIVVSSDHSHLFTLAGDPSRGNDILDFSGNEDNLDGRPFTTLGYVNGMGYRGEEPFNETSCIRKDISGEDPLDIGYLQAALVPRSSATHAGEDVLVLAKGPWAHLFVGVSDQTFIPHGMAYAGCISPYANFCDDQGKDEGSVGVRVTSLYYYVIIVSIILVVLNFF